MAAFGSKLRTLEGGRVMFFCPGCKTGHQVTVETSPDRQGPVWGFNGSGDAPTFTPSVLVQGKQLELDENGKWTGDWLRDANGEPLPMVCHTFVTDGRIQFLGDCTHALAGQTVDLPNQPYHEGA